MKFHIVRIKETLDDILYIYNLTKDELIEENKHIRVWDKLIPGTKIKIPTISEAVELEVSDMEPFVEDYYPTVGDDLSGISIEESEEELKKVEDVVEEEKHTHSNIYEDYDQSKKVDENIKKFSPPKEENKENKEDEDEEDEEFTHFSNKIPKPVLNNYYPYYLGVYNAPRYIPYPIIYYPVYYPKKPN